MSSSGHLARQELARFLRTRREKISPTQVGLPTGLRRRTAGLRREEVAVLAGLSPTWYTYLEQGRAIRPSPQALDSLARVLQFTEDERRYIHTLVHGQVERPVPLASDIPVRDLISRIVTGMTAPTYAVDHRCDLLAWNQAAADWYSDFGALPPGRRNMLDWMLTYPEARERLVDWAEETRDIVERWRGDVARWPNDPRIAELVGRFRRTSPEFDEWWVQHNVSEHRTRLRRLRHPRLGLRTMRLVVLQSQEIMPAIVVCHVIDTP